VGAKMSPMAGVQQYPIYSLLEAVNFLRVQSAAQVLAAGPTASIPYVDPKVLRRWVEEAFGDTDLADAMREVISQGDPYPQTIVRLRELMAQRLSRCQVVLAKNEVA
jgi:hypothetical protein